MAPNRALCLVLLGLALAACQTTGKPRRASGKRAVEPAAAPKQASKRKPARKRPAAASVPDGVAALAFPVMEKGEGGQDLIRVKVYPHAKGDHRTGLAEKVDEVAVAGSCKEQRGRADKAGTTGETLREGTRFAYKASELTAPVWLVCEGGATVERGAGMTAHRYAGALYVRRVDDDKAFGRPVVEVVNVVAMEEYLRGVVPSEVIPSWPADTLKAQAVAARTYAYYNVAHNLRAPTSRFYDVDDTALTQAYGGLTVAMDATDRAVRDTAGVVLSWRGHVVLSFFHTDAGGHTESAEAVFGLAAPYCRAKKEPVVHAKSAWSKTVGLAELTTRLAPHLPAGRAVAGLEVAAGDVTSSGRPKGVTVVLEGGARHRVEAPPFKKALGLRSGLFRVAPEPGAVRIDGSGFGHGVGLSQQGAKELAVQKAWDWKAILRFYYEGTTLCRLGPGASDVPACRAPTAGLSPDGEAGMTPRAS